MGAFFPNFSTMRVTQPTNVDHRNLIEEYIMRSIPMSNHTTEPRAKYYFVGFREGQTVHYPPDTPGIPSSDTGFACLAYRYDVKCVGIIFERMFATVCGFSASSHTVLTVSLTVS
jgi:hypothetical protein